MNIFSEDNFLNRALNLCGDIILANILFVICCIPIVTIGPSMTALYHCMLRSVKGNNNGTFKTFFRAFRENFKQSFGAWIGFLLIFMIFFMNINFLKQTESVITKPLLIGSYSILLLLAILVLYIFPVIAAFEGTLKNHLRNAMLFAFTNLPSTLGILVLTALPFVLLYINYSIILLFLVCWTFFLFALIAYLKCKMFYRMFQPYLGEEEEEVNETFSIDADQADGLIELFQKNDSNADAQ